MPDLRQALKDFVATANSGKYTDDYSLLSKFPELKGYDVNSLKDFVATANSGKYTNEDELFSKFPEFNVGGVQPVEVKKKEVVLPPSPSPYQKPMELPLVDGSSVSAKPVSPVQPAKPVDETPKEKDYFGGKFGALLRTMDILPQVTGGVSGIGDAIDDLGRAIGSGFSQGAIVTPANKLLVSGKGASSEDIKKYVAAAKEAENLGPSDEMIKFRNVYEKEGKGIWGLVKGLAMNPGAIPEIVISSFSTMLNPTSAATAGSVIGGAATYGALATPEFGGVGAVPSALGAIPYAMGAANVTLETGLTFGELLQDELKKKNLEFNEENVKKILEDDKIVSSIRAKSVARGATIGAIDALTGRLAGKVGAKLIGNTAASKIKSGLAATAIEAAGGSAGEAAGRAVAGQEMDVAEIGLEGIGEVPMAPISIAAEVMKKPVYVVNNELVSEADVKEIIDNTPASELHKIKFDIRNDKAGYNDIIQDKIVTNSIREEVRQVNPDIDEDTLNQIVDLEKQLQKVEGNKTQSGKDKAASIRSQIKTLQENAVQKQSTNESVLRTEQPEVGLQQVGEGNIQPKVTTEGAQEVVSPEVQKEEVVAPEMTEQEQDLERYRLEEKVFEAKKNIARATDTEAAIEEYNAAKKTLDDFDAKIEQKKESKRSSNNVQTLIEDENNASQREGYEYKELYDQDPRLAALQSAKDMVEFIQSGELEKDYIEQGESEENAKANSERSLKINQRDIADLEADLKANPVVSSKTQEEVAPVTEGLKQNEYYHATDSNQILAPSEEGYKKREGNNVVGEGIYFGKDKEHLTDRYGKNLIKVELDIKNPLISDNKYIVIDGREIDVQSLSKEDINFLKGKGYDSIKYIAADRAYSAFDETIVFDKSQIKEISEVSLKTQEEVTPAVEITPAKAQLQIEEEQYEPITEKQVTHEAFTRDNAIDYEEDFRTGDNGREYTYLSSITVEAIDDNSGDTIGNLVKIIDEDGTISWQAQDTDGNELGKQSFDSKTEAKKALVDNWNKIQKKEFDKEIKRKAKAAEKTAAKEAKAAEKAAAKEAKKAEAESKKKTKLAQNEQVQPQRAGDRTGRTEVSPIEPLEGAPSVPGVNGPDPQLVAVAEEYAKENGIPFKRQAEYVKVDEDRAIKIADAYDKMANDPQNPKVKEAYQNLIKQTIAQYNALVKAGYKFWFMDLNIPSNQEYASSPYNAIRDLRKNKEMGVFPTTDGYGDGGINELDVQNNPMLADTGIQWPVGGINGPMKTVLANDLFRAVHDAFGHGLEGAGFRARGEENAWQAHVRLFTGSAIGAITSETRGQNSWLNFGPHGESNRNAKVEDTIFADQKVGLMPEWTWKEGLAADMEEKKPTAPKEKTIVEEEEPTAEQMSEIDALLDLDVDDEDNMLKVLNALDRADKAISKRLRGGANDVLLGLPLSTIQVVIKGVKALVKGGMLLRDAIKKVSSDNNISQQIVKDILNVSEIQEGFDAVMSKVDAMVERQRRRGTPEARMVSNIDTFVRKSEVYQNANDSQKKILEREARARAGVSARRAPSIGRVLGVLKDITNVSRQDKLKIISEIRKLSKDAAKDLAAEIRSLATEGKITAIQAANIVARFAKVNMLSEISVSSFVDYMTNVFKDAEYASKLREAKSTKKELTSLSKNKDKNANLRDLAQEFVKIDPAMVEDIDAYNEMASQIKEAIKGSSIRGKNVNFAQMVNIDKASEYINKTMEAQKEKLKEQRVAEIQNLMGVDMSEFSYEQLASLLESDKPITKYNEGIIRDTINKAFRVFSSIIKETISTGKDAFTDEDVKFTESQKDVVKRFMAMDLNQLKPKEALEAVDALANFLQNQSTAKMESVVSKYQGLVNARKIKAEGIKAFPLKKYWSKTIGRFLGEQTTPLPILFERMFKGFNRGGDVMKAMGLSNLINNKASAERQTNNIVEDYVDSFYKKKANGEDFNTAFNNVERGMASFMMRNVIGTQEKMDAEFKRRKGLIEESIQVLSQGNEQEKAKAELYQKVYDKVLKDSNSIEEVQKKTDSVNLEAINFWMEQWDNKYEQLSDVAQNVYNKILGKDINYTPDRFFKLSTDTGIVEMDNDESAFLVNSGVSNLYQRETGVLMTAVRPESLPVNPESGDVNRYIDLSFDNNNANSMYDALVDINTAAPIKQIQSFLNSSDYKSIVPSADDARILKDRIQLYVRNIRNKNPFSTDELASVVKKLNKIAAIGVGQALGGVTQPIKQVIPVAMNTVINGGGLDISAAINQDKIDFINNSNHAIANRGVESQAQIDSINKLIEQASETTGEKALKLIEKANEKWLKLFLVNPDVFIARASWLTYYEQYLKDHGVDTKGIDYKTHKLDVDAADYAQRMVDRQQNVSDTDLSGKMFANKESANQLLVKTLMPFASFRMNQAARLGADLATLTNKTSTKEDKKIAAKSLAGFGVEMATFRLISVGISLLLGKAALKAMGKDEDDEEYEKRKSALIKGALTGSFTDVLSPLPVADKLIQAGGAPIMQSIEDATGLPVSIYSPRKDEFLQNAGLFGIAGDRANQLFDLMKLSTTGEYKNDFGKVKTISSDDQKGLSLLIAPAIMTNIGLAPSEVNSIVRYAIKDAKKAKTSTQQKRESSERVQEKEESKNQKVEALQNVRQRESDPRVIEAIDEKIDELRATKQETEKIRAENKIEKQLKKSLLTDPETGEEYDTESELKRYNPNLWEKNFGPNSKWYQDHQSEEESTKLMNKEIREMEDKEYGYIPPAKRTTRRRNSDGSIRRGYRRARR